MAYKDWEKHLCERHFAARLSGSTWSPPSWLRRRRQARRIAALGNTGRQQRMTSRGQGSMGFLRLQHRSNTLHMVAVLARWGVPGPWALALARRWERARHGWLDANGK